MTNETKKCKLYHTQVMHPKTKFIYENSYYAESFKEVYDLLIDIYPNGEIIRIQVY